MKIALKILLMTCIIGYVTFAIVRFGERPENGVCAAVDIEVEEDTMSSLISTEHSQSIMARHKIAPEGQRLYKTNLGRLEQVLEQDPYISEAQCYYKSNTRLCIRIKPLQPVLHVISEDGEDYYIDTTGVIMPVGKFNLDLCVATGKVNKATVKKDLVPLAWYIYNSNYWRKQVQQIHVSSHGDIYIIPREGRFRINLGTADNFE